MLVTEINNSNINPTFQKNFLKRTKLPNTEQLIELAENLSFKFDDKSENILSALKGKSPKRISFFVKMVEKYNERNFELSESLKEDYNLLYKIFDIVQKPHSEHFKILKNQKTSFKAIEELFSLAKDKKELKFIDHIQTDILDGSNSSNQIIAAMLKSDFREAYISNPQLFSSYLKLNKEDPELLSKLEKMLADKSFDPKKYDAQYKISHQLDSDEIVSPLRAYKNELIENYTDEKANVLDNIIDKFFEINHNISADEAIYIKKIYDSVTKDNFEIRNKIIRSVLGKNHDIISKESILQDLRSLDNIFDIIDKNKQYSKLCKKILAECSKKLNPQTLEEIVKTIPAKKGLVFFDNLKNIINLSSKQEMKQALIDELENPFYIPASRMEIHENDLMYGFTENISSVGGIFKKLKNKFNQIRYNYFTRETEQAIAENSTIATSELPKINPINNSNSDTTLSQTIKTSDGNSSLKITAKIRESAKDRKIRLSKEVNEYVKSKLGNKTYDTQQGRYIDSVTSMRLKLLPEIFASIKDTASAARADGKNIRSRNNDAIRLYELINGKNRKLIRYMLRVRNNKNNRIYEVKDIIQYIKNAENHIAECKKVNKDFKAINAKIYYESLYQKQFEQFGKLKPQRKPKKKA